jgi:hypothetical protein
MWIDLTPVPSPGRSLRLPGRGVTPALFSLPTQRGEESLLQPESGANLTRSGVNSGYVNS